MSEGKAQQLRGSLRSSDGSSNSGGSSKKFAVEKNVTRDGKPNIFRVFGGIDEFQTNERAWLLCDDGKPRPFVFANDHQGEGVLKQIVGDSANFYKGGILESRKGADGGQEFIYAQVDPDFIKSLVSAMLPPSKTRYSWKPKKEWLYNVLDRDLDTNTETKAQFNFCRENKHSKLLRMRQTAWQCLLNTSDNDGALTDYDVNYTITGSELQTKHDIRRAGIQPGVVQGDFTEEEKAYTLYNLKDESQLSSAFWILKHLSQKITRIDEIMGTNFMEQLIAQQEVEKAEWAARGQDSAPEERSVSDDVDDSHKSAIPAPAVVSAPAAVTPVVAPAAVAPAAGLTPRRSLVASSVPQIPCPAQCGGMVTPDTEICPKCHTPLLSPCDHCHKLFSSYAKECPHCGQKYPD